MFVKAYEATKPVAPDAVRKSIAEWAENDDLCDRLNALFEKTNDPEDFLFRQNSVQGPTGRLHREQAAHWTHTEPKKNPGRTVVGRTCIKERGEEE